MAASSDVVKVEESEELAEEPEELAEDVESSEEPEELAEELAEETVQHIEFQQAM